MTITYFFGTKIIQTGGRCNFDGDFGTGEILPQDSTDRAQLEPVDAVGYGPVEPSAGCRFLP